MESPAGNECDISLPHTSDLENRDGATLHTSKPLISGKSLNPQFPSPKKQAQTRT